MHAHISMYAHIGTHAHMFLYRYTSRLLAQWRRAGTSVMMLFLNLRSQIPKSAHVSNASSIIVLRPQTSKLRTQNPDLRIISRCIPIAHRPQSNEANKNKTNDSKIVSCNLCSRVGTVLGRRMQPSGVGLHHTPALPFAPIPTLSSMNRL